MFLSSVVRLARLSLSFSFSLPVLRLARLCRVLSGCLSMPDHTYHCSAGFTHLMAVVKMENWLISFNVYI